MKKHVHTFIWIKGILAAGALGYLLHIVEFDKIRAAMAEADTLFILASVALLPLNLLLCAWRWQTALRRVMPGVRFRAVFGSMMTGRSLGIFTPIELGDFAGRAFYLKHNDRWELAALAFAERMPALTCYLGFGLAALAHFLVIRPAEATLAWELVFVFGLAACLTLLFFVVNPSMAHGVIGTVIRSERVRRELGFLRRFSRRDTGLLLAQSALVYAVFTTQFYLLLLAFAPRAALLESYTSIALVFFVKSCLPSLTFMDLGIREGASVYFLGFFGVAGAAAFNAAFLTFVVNRLLPALLGLPFVLRMNLRHSARVEQSPSVVPAE